MKQRAHQLREKLKRAVAAALKKSASAPFAEEAPHELPEERTNTDPHANAVASDQQTTNNVVLLGAATVAGLEYAQEQNKVGGVGHVDPHANADGVDTKDLSGSFARKGFLPMDEHD